MTHVWFSVKPLTTWASLACAIDLCTIHSQHPSSFASLESCLGRGRKDRLPGQAESVRQASQVLESWLFHSSGRCWRGVQPNPTTSSHSHKAFLVDTALHRRHLSCSQTDAGEIRPREGSPTLGFDSMSATSFSLVQTGLENRSYQESMQAMHLHKSKRRFADGFFQPLPCLQSKALTL